jgi:WD40 repeat protein
LERDVSTDPATEVVSTIIPFKNGRALAAYYCGVFSFIPCAGLLLGPAAFVLGILGLRFLKSHPGAHGTGHAIAGIIMGLLTSVGNWGGVIAILVMGGLAYFSGTTTTRTLGGPVAVKKTPSNQDQPQGKDQIVNNGQPLFSANSDLLHPNQQLTIPPEPGRVAALRMGQKILALAFSPDGKTLAVATPVDLKLWSLKDSSYRTIPVVAPSLAFSPDGKHLAVGREKPMAAIELYNPQTAQVEQKVFEGKADETAERMTFSPDGTHFVATRGTTFDVWETATWTKRNHAFNSPEKLVVALTFDPRNVKTLLVSMDSGVLFIDVTTMRQQFLIKGEPPGTGTAAVALSPDSKTVATGAFWGDIDLLDVSQRKFLRRVPSQKGRITSLTFTADGKALVSTCFFEGVVKVVDVTNRKELSKRKTDPESKGITAATLSPDGRRLVVAGDSGIVSVWDFLALQNP